jgi:3-deoxy-D-manno-oct-2-ulosonic acid (Kdo) hydroxylase
MAPSDSPRSPQGWIEVHDFRYPDGYVSPDAAERARHYCRLLEHGEILLFPNVIGVLPITPELREVMFGADHANTSVHKNVSFRPNTGELRGYDGAGKEMLREFLAWHSLALQRFVDNFLAPYAAKYAVDFGSFRPIQAQGRTMPLHKRDDLLHFDAFPSRPTHGGRILRSFVNLNPTEPRVWEVGEPFHVTAPRFVDDPTLRDTVNGSPFRKLSDATLAAVGVTKGRRSAYDRFMLRFHDLLKEDTVYQQTTPKRRIEIPPGSAWLVYTDGVPHAVLSGRYALEQTFIVSAEAQVAPEVTPIRLLEKMYGKAMSA